MLKKILSTTIGFASLTLNKVQDTVNDLVENGSLSQEEGKKFVDELIEDLENRKETYEQQVSSLFSNVLSVMSRPSNEEVEVLEARIKALETRIEVLEAEQLSDKVLIKKRSDDNI